MLRYAERARRQGPRRRLGDATWDPRAATCSWTTCHTGLTRVAISAAGGRRCLLLLADTDTSRDLLAPGHRGRPLLVRGTDLVRRARWHRPTARARPATPEAARPRSSHRAAPARRPLERRPRGAQPTCDAAACSAPCPAATAVTAAGPRPAGSTRGVARGAAGLRRLRPGCAPTTPTTNSPTKPGTLPVLFQPTTTASTTATSGTAAASRPPARRPASRCGSRPARHRPQRRAALGVGERHVHLGRSAPATPGTKSTFAAAGAAACGPGQRHLGAGPRHGPRGGLHALQRRPQGRRAACCPRQLVGSARAGHVAAPGRARRRDPRRHRCAARRTPAACSASAPATCCRASRTGGWQTVHATCHRRPRPASPGTAPTCALQLPKDQDIPVGLTLHRRPRPPVSRRGSSSTAGTSATYVNYVGPQHGFVMPEGMLRHRTARTPIALAVWSLDAAQRRPRPGQPGGARQLRLVADRPPEQEPRVRRQDVRHARRPHRQKPSR